MTTSRNQIMRNILPLMGAALISACASQPEDLGTTRISPIMYRHMDCEQLAMEGSRVARRETILFNSLEKTADTDAWQMGVGLILLWPVLFGLEGGDGAEAAEYSLLKGERDAIEQAAIIQKCGPLGLPARPVPKPLPEEEEDKV